MPGGDGLQMVQNINQKLENKPMLYFFTGYSDSINQEAEKFGVMRVFPKPFDMSLIIEILS